MTTVVFEPHHKLLRLSPFCRPVYIEEGQFGVNAAAKHVLALPWLNRDAAEPAFGHSFLHDWLVLATPVDRESA
jgi:hypothetical protein